MKQVERPRELEIIPRQFRSAVAGLGFGLLATGGTMAAAVALFRKVGAEVVGGACIIELNFLNGRDKLDIPFSSLIDYDE